MKYKKQSHYVYCCDYHVVISTKYRRKIFKKGLSCGRLQRSKEKRQDYPELEIKYVNHDEDHVHVLILIPPKVSVESVIRITIPLFNKTTSTPGLKSKERKFSFRTS